MSTSLAVALAAKSSGLRRHLEPEERHELPHFPEPSTSSFEGVSNEKPMHAGESAGSNGPLLLSSILGVKGAVRAASCARCCLVWLYCIWY